MRSKKLCSSRQRLRSLFQNPRLLADLSPTRPARNVWPIQRAPRGCYGLFARHYKSIEQITKDCAKSNSDQFAQYNYSICRNCSTSKTQRLFGNKKANIITHHPNKYAENYPESCG